MRVFPHFPVRIPFFSRHNGPPDSNRRPFRITRNGVLFCAILFLLLATTSTAGYFFLKYKQAVSLSSGTPLVMEREKQSTIAHVARLIDVPTDEDPMVTVITDVEKLKTQAFFAKAKNGDKVLIYAKARKAILYNPSANKILEVGPLLAPSQGPQVAGAVDTDSTRTQESPANPTPSPRVSAKPVTPTPTAVPATVTVILANGTGTSGATYIAQQQLEQYPQEYVIAQKKNAVKKDYEKTLIIDLTKTHDSAVQRLVQLLGGEAASLPAEEDGSLPKADVLIIIGKDKI